MKTCYVNRKTYNGETLAFSHGGRVVARHWNFFWTPLPWAADSRRWDTPANTSSHAKGWNFWTSLAMIFNGSSRNKIPDFSFTQVHVCWILQNSWPSDLKDIGFHGLRASLPGLGVKWCRRNPWLLGNWLSVYIASGRGSMHVYCVSMLKNTEDWSNCIAKLLDRVVGV